MAVKSHCLLSLVTLMGVIALSRCASELIHFSLDIEDTGVVLSEEELRGELTTSLKAIPQSHTIARLAVGERRRRNAADDSISLRFKLSNVTHTFAMTHNLDVMSPNYIIEEVGSDGVPRPLESSLGECYFAREIRDDEMASVTVCGDEIEGIVAAKDHMYGFQPRKNAQGELIVWEVDSSSLPQGKVEGTAGIGCFRPDVPFGGHAHLGEGGTVVGSTVEYSCEAERTMVGAAEARCMRSRQWSQGPPACVKLGSGEGEPDGIQIECPSVRSPSNGEVSVDKEVVWTASYSCHSGYDLRGIKKRYCQDNGEWTGPDPYCTIHPVPVPSQWMNGSITEEEALTSGARKRRGILKLLDGADEILEVMLYLDLQLFNRFSRNRALLERHTLTIANLYAYIMQDPSIGQPVFIKVVRIVIETFTTRVTTSREAQLVSSSFCPLQRSLKPAPGSPGYFDYALLITGREMCTVYNGQCEDGTIGYALLGGVCTDDSCAVIEHYGLQTGFTLAHETGHGLDLRHDYYGNTCPSVGHVMAPQLGRGKIMYKWSQCSMRELMGFRVSGRTQCMREGATNHIVPHHNLPAAFSLDYQCKKTYGEHATRCPFEVSGENVCSYFYCKRDNSGLCWTEYFPAMDGTTCGSNKVCIKGECLANVARTAVDGGWGAWSAWSTCSRTCGCGVKLRQRPCNRPEPKYGGDYCKGHQTEVDLCNKQDCPAPQSDYRKQQCQSYSEPYNGVQYTWDVYERSPENKCSRVCLPNNGPRFYAVFGTFLDGTPCPPSKDYDKAVCVQGACTSIGCDGMLQGSTPDKCGVCNGGNCSCRKVTRTETFTNLGHGYHALFKVDRSWTHVSIVETPPNQNAYMVLKMYGTPLFNGGFRLSLTGTYQTGSAPVVYDRDLGTGQDSLTFKDPLRRNDGYIEALVNGLASSLSYVVTYYEPNDPGVSSCPPPTTPPTTKPTTKPTTPPTTPPPTKPPTPSPTPPLTKPTTPPTTPPTTKPPTPPPTPSPTPPPTKPTTKPTTPPTTPSPTPGEPNPCQGKPDRSVCAIWKRTFPESLWVSVCKRVHFCCSICIKYTSA